MRNWFRKWVAKHLLKAITEDDIIPLEQLTPSQREVYAKQAQLILDLEVWIRMEKQMYLEANKRMFLRARSYNDMMYGMAALYIIDVIRKKLEKIAELK